MSFVQLNLNPSINKALAACGYTEPTPIQAQSIPDILLGKDVIAAAQTGTGKTAAFILPALDKLSNSGPSKNPRILVLTPTRELAKQIMEAARTYGKFMRLNVVNLVGGMPYPQQIRDLARPVDMIVATPGRLLDHLQAKRIDLSHIEMLVLDEADRMLDMGFIDDVTVIAKATPTSRQTLLFTATVNNRLSSVIRQLLKNPVQINLSNDKISPKDIQQTLYVADNHQHKMRLLQHFMDNENMFKAIIFSATKMNADRLADQLREHGYETGALHGDLRQNVRNRTIDQLRRGKIQYLVATDVAARGIDISDVTHVINFDLPKFAEDYVHRIGRTGRAGKSGIAISLAMQSDARHLQKIERYIGQRIQQATIEGLEPKGGLSNKQSGNHEKRSRFSKSGKSFGGKSFGGKSSANRPHTKKSASDKSSHWTSRKNSDDYRSNEEYPRSRKRDQGQRGEALAHNSRGHKRHEHHQHEEFPSVRRQKRGDDFNDGFSGSRDRRNSDRHSDRHINDESFSRKMHRQDSRGNTQGFGGRKHRSGDSYREGERSSGGRSRRGGESYRGNEGFGDTRSRKRAEGHKNSGDFSNYRGRSSSERYTGADGQKIIIKKKHKRKEEWSE